MSSTYFEPLGSIFRKTDVYEVIVWYVLRGSVSVV